MPLTNVTVDMSLLIRKDATTPVELMVTPPVPSLEEQLSIFPPSNSNDYVLWSQHKNQVKEQRKGKGHKETTDITTTATWDTDYVTFKSITGGQYHYLQFDYDNDAEDRSTFHLKP